MIQSRPHLPAGHGELLTRPPYDEWAGLVAANRERASAWRFTVAGRDVDDVRRLAREDVLAVSQRFSAKLRVPLTPVLAAEEPLIMTGHQPELYHTGVWVKDFLLDRIAGSVGANAVDVVVDSDGFDAVTIEAPCWAPDVRRCRQYLAIGTADSCYACSPVPSADDLEVFCTSAGSMLSTLPSPSVKRHFDDFCGHLRSARLDADDLAQLVTIARRRYEAAAGTGYLEAPLTHLARTESFACFIVDMALDGVRFATDYNAELAFYREAHRTRSALQPFPDLAIEHGRVELPLWALRQGTRRTVWASKVEGGIRLLAGDDEIALLPEEPADAVRALQEAGISLAPKALALTLFVRVFCCDLFIHGVGGGRYDRVTDGVCRRFYGVEPPSFAVASLTMYLPIGARIVTDEEVAAAKERMNRLEHNPNQALGDVDFGSEDERIRAFALAAEKSELVSAIALPGADKKSLGGRIRAVNTELAALLEPLRAEYAAELSSLEAQRDASDVFTDRTYPFCFWSPEEIADKVR